jgi:hypothetical protein
MLNFAVDSAAGTRFPQERAILHDYATSCPEKACYEAFLVDAGTVLSCLPLHSTLVIEPRCKHKISIVFLRKVEGTGYEND